MSLRVAKLLLFSFILCIVIGLSLPPLVSSLTCGAVTGRQANLSRIFLAGEYIAGSLLMYSRFSLTIAGVSGARPVNGPYALLLLNSSQIRANGVNASLHVGLPAGQKCRCSLSGSGVLNCSELVAPTPPWPAHNGCRWYLSKGGMLMEINATHANCSCLDSATSSVRRPDILWPKSPLPAFAPNVGDILYRRSSVRIYQEFNGRNYSAAISDADLDIQWPVRISAVRYETVTLPSGNLSRALIYRRYFGWSQHCLHRCRVVYKPGSVIETYGETCENLANPLDNATMAAMATNGCVWTFTVNCHPILVRSNDLSQPC